MIQRAVKYSRTRGVLVGSSRKCPLQDIARPLRASFLLPMYWHSRCTSTSTPRRVHTRCSHTHHDDASGFREGAAAGSCVLLAIAPQGELPPRTIPTCASGAPQVLVAGVRGGPIAPPGSRGSVGQQPPSQPRLIDGSRLALGSGISPHGSSGTAASSIRPTGLCSVVWPRSHSEPCLHEPVSHGPTPAIATPPTISNMFVKATQVGLRQRVGRSTDSPHGQVPKRSLKAASSSMRQSRLPNVLYPRLLECFG
eukprot:5694571-Alexandrium_andersonii.AAC.4